MDRMRSTGFVQATLMTVAMLLGIVVAAYWPALRAANLDPAIALRKG